MAIDIRAIEWAHIPLAVAIWMIYLLERELGASRRTAFSVCLAVGIVLLLLR